MERIVIAITTIFLLVVGCERSTPVNLGDGYILVNSASFNDLTIVTSEDIVVIKGHILDYAYDSCMIIVSQRPRDSIQGIETLTYKKYKKAFFESDLVQYWIIDKRLPLIYNKEKYTFSNVYGPYKKYEYLQKRNELGVTKELTLKD
jgi:hypothetical protein